MTENAFCALLKYCIISSADVRVSCGTCTMRQIREKFQRPLLIGYLIVDLAKTHKARRGSGIWPKYSAGFGKTLTGYGIWLLPRGSGVRQNLSMDEKRKWQMIFGILMKEVGCGISREKGVEMRVQNRLFSDPIWQDHRLGSLCHLVSFDLRACLHGGGGP